MDPNRGKAQLPTSLHGFLYTGNSPVSYVDPTGRDLVEMSVALVAAAAVTAAIFASVNSYRYWRTGSDFMSPAERNLPEVEAAYGTARALNFDEGVEGLIYYWWSLPKIERDIYQAFSVAQDFRNENGLAVEQDPRIAAAEHYLWGMKMHFAHEWYPGKAVAAVGETIREDDPFWLLPTGSFPPSLYAENGYEWFRRGRDGESTIMVPVECWSNYPGRMPSYCK